MYRKHPAYHKPQTWPTTPWHWHGRSRVATADQRSPATSSRWKTRTACAGCAPPDVWFLSLTQFATIWLRVENTCSVLPLWMRQDRDRLVVHRNLWCPSFLLVRNMSIKCYMLWWNRKEITELDISYTPGICSILLEQDYGIKNKAAIILTFDLHCKAIAAFFFILYCRLISGHCQTCKMRSTNSMIWLSVNGATDYIKFCKFLTSRIHGIKIN